MGRTKASNMNILWLEDEKKGVKPFAETITGMTDERARFEFATTYQQAREKFHKKSFHSVIIDIKMKKGADGLEFANLVRNKNLLVPLFVVSSYLHEYTSRLEGVVAVSGTYDRTDLLGAGFKTFTHQLIERTRAYKEYIESELDKLTYDQFKDHLRQRELAKLHWSINKHWIRQIMRREKLAWIVVCKSETVASSKTMKDFPTAAEKESLAKRFKAIPFVYGPDIVSEESPVTAPLYNEFYPVVKYSVRGSVNIGNLDTGTNLTLISDEILPPEPGSSIQTGIQRQREFDFSFRVANITLLDENHGQTKIPLQLPVAVIHSWKHSPWVEFNPDRTALFGRDIFSCEDLRVCIESHCSACKMKTRVSKLIKEE